VFASKWRRLKEKSKLELSSFNNFDIDNTPQLQISSRISHQGDEPNLNIREMESSGIIYNNHERSYRGKIMENSFHYAKYE
jgi:hypothetical protein